MSFSAEETENILSLLLDSDFANVQIGLSVLNNAETAVDERVIRALAMLAVLLPCHTDYKSQARVRSVKKLPPHYRLGKEIQKLTEKTLKHCCKLNKNGLDFGDFLKVLYIFTGLNEARWKEHWANYEAERALYEPLFLRIEFWRKTYFQLMRSFFYKKQERICIDLCDVLLEVEYRLDWAGYRYDMLMKLIHKGEGHEQIPHLFRYLDYSIKHEPPSELCDSYNSYANIYHFAVYRSIDHAKAIEYYYKSIEAYNKYGGDEESTALSANNIAYIIHGCGDDSKADLSKIDEAYRLIQYAIELCPYDENYLDSLAHHEWIYNKDVEKAKEIFEKVVLINRDHVATNAQLCRIYLAENNLQVAEQYLRRLLKNKISEQKEEVPHCLLAFDAFLANAKQADAKFLEVVAKARKALGGSK
jgi:hypothetical protein